MLSLVERLVRAGFALHWLHPRSKRPIGENWSEKPVATLRDLSRTYQEGMNVGVRLGEPSKVGGGYLHVFDIDVRIPETANLARAVLADIIPELDQDKIPVVRSGSGGPSRHIYAIFDRPLRSQKLAHGDRKIIGPDGKEHWDWEIELFGTGKQVVIPPSIHPDTGNEYVWERAFDFDLLEMGIGPFLSADLIKEAIRTRYRDRDIDDILGGAPEPLGLNRSEIEAILRDLPLPDYCEDRDGWLQVGMALHHETGGSPEGFELWCAFSRQSAKFNARDQKRVWRSFRRRRNIVTMASLKQAVRDVQLNAMFEDLGADPTIDGEEVEEEPSPRLVKLRKAEVEDELGPRVPVKVARLNKRHAIARVSGKTVVLDFQPDGSVTYGSVTDLHAYYENDRIAVEKRTMPITKAWMQHKRRRTYEGIVFAPQGAPEKVYNHWQGFAVQPDPKASCKLFLKHLWHVIADRQQHAYDYLLGYMGHMIQRPWEKPGVALVFRGKKGTGKDTVGDYLGGLFPHHHVKVSNPEQLYGRFNAHQEKCLLLHVEEGFWAGDKKAEGALKHVITSEKVLIEPKGVNAFQIDSVLRVLITSNEEWVVPATADERRYFVVNVSERRIGDHKYFEAIRKEMVSGGRAALLDFLQNHDISDFDVRAVPDTRGLAEQKIQGLRNIELWWYGILQSGELDLSDFDTEQEDWRQGPVTVDRAEFREAYSRWMRGRRYDGEELPQTEFGKRLRKMVPGLGEKKRRVDGRFYRLYTISPLDDCRSMFDQFIGSQISWDSD